LNGEKLILARAGQRLIVWIVVLLIGDLALGY
jgi:hypothetical protein